MRRGLAAIIVFIFFLSPARTQDPGPTPVKSTPYVEVYYHSGIFWSRTENLKEQFDQGYRAFEARFGFQSTGGKAWQQLHKYPKFGFGLQYSDLVKTRKDTVVGNPFGLFGFYSAPLLSWNRFTLYPDISVGLSYTSLIYHPRTNPINDVVASHINLFFGFNMRLYLALTERFHMSVGGGLTHHSNGRIKVPQKGVNSWGWSAGMNYMLSQPVEEYQHHDFPEFKAFEEIQFMAAVGTVEAQPQGGKETIRYFNYSITADHVVKFNPKMALSLGLDILYDGSLGLAIKGVPPEEVSYYQKMYLGSHLGYQHTIQRVTLLFNLGTYFRQSSYDRGFWFGRAGGRIHISEHLYAHLAIKTKNGMRSDWIEWGAAYHMKIRR